MRKICFKSLTFFRKGFRKFRTLFYGYQMGLSVILDPIVTNEARVVSTLSCGGAKVLQYLMRMFFKMYKIFFIFKVLIHSPEDYPGISSTEKIIGNGTESYVRILGTKLISSKNIKSLAPSQRKCIFENEKSLDYFNFYRDTNCGTECILRKTYDYCKCIPFTFPQKGW